MSRHTKEEREKKQRSDPLNPCLNNHRTCLSEFFVYEKPSSRLRLQRSLNELTKCGFGGEWRSNLITTERCKAVRDHVGLWWRLKNTQLKAYTQMRVGRK